MLSKATLDWVQSWMGRTLKRLVISKAAGVERRAEQTVCKSRKGRLTET